VATGAARRRQWDRWWRWVTSAVLATLVAVIGLPSPSWAGFTAQEVDPANAFSAGTLQLDGTTSTTCYSTGTGGGGPIGSNLAACTGSPLPSGPLTATSVSNASSTLDNAGSVTPRAADIALLSCGAAEVTDSSGGGDTGLIYGSVTPGTAFTSPVNSGFTSSGLTLSGAAGSYIGTTQSVLSPSSFTLVAWVRTTIAGGGIIGFSAEQPDRVGTAADRMLWIEPSGQVAFGVLSNRATMQQVTSTAVVDDGNWHFVAATFSYPSMSVDVDGATTTAATAVAGTYPGYWHLGWAGDSTWSNPGPVEYLSGSEFGVGVFPPLSPADLSTLENALSAAVYATAVGALSPSALWLLSDSGTTAYTGTIPALGPTPLCMNVLVDVQSTQGSTVACVFPAGPGACPSTPPSTATLNTLGTDPMPPVGSLSPVTVTIRMTLASPSGPGVAGLHLIPVLTFATTASGWTAGLEYPSASLEM
jgi:hypothetical protein